MYLVSIYFDEKTDERIRKYINQPELFTEQYLN